MRLLSSSAPALVAGLLIALVSCTLLPYEARGQPVTLGVRGGMNLSILKGDTEAFFENEIGAYRVGRRTSFHVGGVAHLPLKPWLAVQPELSYVQRGASVTQTGGVLGDGSGTFRFSYIDLPLLFRAHVPGDDGRARPFVVVGPTLGVSLTAGVTTDSGTSITYESISTTDLGAVVGAGVEFSLSSSRSVSLSARYNPGLRDIATEDNVSIRNSAFVMSAAYTFGP